MLAVGYLLLVIVSPGPNDEKASQEFGGHSFDEEDCQVVYTRLIHPLEPLDSQVPLTPTAPTV